MNDTNFQKQLASNYAALRGTVKGVTPSPNQSGDFDVALEVNSTTYTAPNKMLAIGGINIGFLK